MALTCPWRRGFGNQMTLCVKILPMPACVEKDIYDTEIHPFTYILNIRIKIVIPAKGRDAFNGHSCPPRGRGPLGHGGGWHDHYEPGPPRYPRN